MGRPSATAPIRRNGLARDNGFAVRVRSPVTPGIGRVLRYRLWRNSLLVLAWTGSGPRDRGGHPGDHQIGGRRAGGRGRTAGWRTDVNQRQGRTRNHLAIIAIVKPDPIGECTENETRVGAEAPKTGSRLGPRVASPRGRNPVEGRSRQIRDAVETLIIVTTAAGCLIHEPNRGAGLVIPQPTGQRFGGPGDTIALGRGGGAEIPFGGPPRGNGGQTRIPTPWTVRH